MRSPVRLGLLAAVLTGVLVAGIVRHESGVQAPGGLYVRTFDHSRHPLEVVLARGDGQFFAAIAQDPTLARPRAFVVGAKDEAYRAQRPLASYLAWAASAGQHGAVPLVMAVLFVLGTALLVGVFATAARARGAAAALGLVAILLPPSLAALEWFGPEPLGMGLALAGVLAWDRVCGARWPALILLSLAGLTRESLLLLPILLGLSALVQRDRRLRDVVGLAVPAAAWLAWVAVVHGRLGYWPWDSGVGRLSAPFRGVVRGIGTWPGSGYGEWFCGGGLAGLLVASVWRRPRDRATWIVIAYALFATVLGANVWLRWQDFSRPLFPLYVFGLLAVIGPTTSVLATELPRRDPRSGVVSDGD